MSTNPITARRDLTVERGYGDLVRWVIDEFASGNVMLTAGAASSGIQFSAHFDAEQWQAFQGLVAGVSS